VTLKIERWVVPGALLLALGLLACQNRSTSGEGVQSPEAGTTTEAAPAASAEKAGGKAVFAEMEYNFGEVDQGESIVHEFKVRNEGREVLNIKKVRGS